MNPEIKILVIDDEEGIRDWLSFELGRQGYLVITAENGRIGIEKVKKERFDIAIIDMKMPEMDGVTVLEELKRVDSDIEVIISTGYATMETAIESMRRGACDYITKPYNVEEISIIVEKAIEKQRLKETIALYEISKAILSTVDFDRLLKIIINLTMKVLKSDDASLMLFDKEKKLFVAAASYEITIEYDKKAKFEAGKRIAGWVVKERKPLLLIGDLKNDSRFKDIEGREEIKSSMVIPLIGKDEVMGALNINRIKDEEPFTENDLRKAGIFASQIALAVENANLFKELNTLYISAIRSLANAIDAKDSYTNKHSERVTEMAVAIAEEMELSTQEIQKIQLASQIHDLGKIGIHDYIVKKKGKLTDKEMEEMKSHPLKGAQILEPFESLKDISQIIKQHHESYDGNGYPDKIKGNEILLEARIIAVADAYDAMTSDRSYRQALTKEEAKEELISNINKRFDPDIVKAFLKILDSGKL